MLASLLLIAQASSFSIMAGAALGGVLLDRFSASATLVGGTVLLVLAALTVGNGERVRPRET